MPPFLSLHAVAANRGDGLHPELLALFRRVAADASTTANAGVQEITASSIAPSRLKSDRYSVPVDRTATPAPAQN